MFKSNSGSIGRLLNGVIVYENPCFDWEASAGDGDSSSYSGVTTDPTFNSIQADCGTGGGGLTDDSPETPAAVEATNSTNSPNSTFNTSLPVINTLTNTFVNGATETAATPVTSLSSIDPFFEDTTYIGAVQDVNDTWWQGWTCGLPNGEAC